MSHSYDGILLGAGHNALVLQAYLCRAGIRCLALERAASPGGGLAAASPRLPGFIHNTHSFFHRGITDLPWYRDLELARHGVRYIEPELNAAVIFGDGRVLEWWTDSERTAASVAEFSPRDAAALRRWMAEFEPIVERVIAPEARSPPLPPERRRELLSRSASGRRLLEVERRSPLEFVRSEFEDDAVRAGLLFFNGLREIDLRLEGFGHAVPALLASRRKAQMCAGGSAALARGLLADIREHGGEVRCGVEIRAITVAGRRAAGVELTSGERIPAPAFVASGLNPQQTFLELLPADAVDPEVRERAAAFRYNVLAPLFTLNVALDEPPRYAAGARHPEIEKAFMVVLGLEGLAGIEAMVAAHEAGRLPPFIAWGACPTRFDPGQAPPGKHTAFLWQKVPYRLAGGRTWIDEGPVHARRLLDFWAGQAPSLAAPGAILDSFHQTPLDTARSLPNMREGDLLVGSFADGQVGWDRPFAGAGGYRTPLPGLYLCGGSTHPGGNITGLCGYNAAQVIAADLEIEPWWRPVPLEEAWAAAP